ncbi:glycosyltransferase family 4 protein [Thalassobaculum sp.]|uniref:glycosyltransferase family 4 protein n=1 Tax=Thalassobaculum sp. TaxID=2022740 RepID=UPI0032EF407D
MARIVFGMIDNNTRPIGGVKVIYQAVAGLRRFGLDAYVGSAVGVPGWLAGSRTAEEAAILDMRQPHLIGPDDLYVATDAIGPGRMPLLLRLPERRVLFIQNHNALRFNGSIDWVKLRHIRCLTVSNYSRRVLLEQAGFREAHVVSPGVDLSVFRPAPRKRHRIAYMPRKWPGAVDQLKGHVRRTIEWLPIDGCSEAETAAILAESTIFLNLGRGEGLGLPPLEAMAAGCVLCGFASQGTTDFASTENGFWVDEGDGPGCIQAINAAVAAFDDQERVARLIQAGMATAQRYSLPLFEERMAAYFRALL